MQKNKFIAENRRARFNYTIIDTYEAGLVLTGSEVKSLRKGRANIAESYARADDGELVLANADIPQYEAANRFNHEPKRVRKLLLKRREIAKLLIAIEREGHTLVPLKLYFNARGIAKIQIGLAKGKKMTDKRETIKRRDWDRAKGRLMRLKG